MITSFRGEYRFLSNFWLSPITYGELRYMTVEHAYQAAKTVIPAEREYVRVAPTPASAKRRGHAVTRRTDWDWYAVRIFIMEELLRLKFSDPLLRARLLATREAELIEGNAWGDRFWGCVPHAGGWVGDNHLGRLLMKIREELR